MFRRKFWISLILTIPAVLYSSMIQEWLHYTAPTFTGHTFVAPLFGTLTFMWGGPVFLRGGWGELRDRKPGMMLLISMGLLVAFGASVATVPRDAQTVQGGCRPGATAASSVRGSDVGPTTFEWGARTRGAAR